MPNSQAEAGSPRGAQSCRWTSGPRLAAVDVEQVAKVAVLTLGALYAVGLLIANLELARYGVVRLDLVQPEYVMAAVLWLLLSMLPTVVLFAWFGLADRVQRRMRIKPGWPGLVRLALLVVVTLTSLLGSLYLLGAMLWRLLGGGESPSFHQTLDLFGGLFSSSMGFLILRRALTDPSAGRFHRATGLYMLAGGLFFYATDLYPWLPREIGGGRRPVLCIALKDALPIAWQSRGIEIHDARRVGPVALVADMADRMVVSAWPRSDHNRPAVGIPRDAIQILTFEKPQGALVKCEWGT